MINSITFSKDRAAQLRLLLGSIRRNAPSIFDNITVIYTASTADYAKAYTKLEAENILPVTFKQEVSLVSDTLEVMESYAKNKNSFFTVFPDDSIFYRNFNDQKNVIEHCLTPGNDICCFSLRLGENTTETNFCQPGNHIKLQATKVGNVCKWRHGEYPSSHGYGYPLALDGHVYRINEILNIVRKVGNFQGVNALEGSMGRFIGDLQPCMASFSHSVLVSTPVNTHCTNAAGVYFPRTTKELNDKYLNNEAINYDAIDFSKVNGTHNELDFTYMRI